MPRLSIVLLFVSCSITFAQTDAAPARPNIVVLLCDDLGYGDLGCYGHPVIETPNLDRLAASGIRLTSCYSAAPVCSPSRVGLLTGRSPNRAGVYDWIPPAKEPRPDLRHLVHLRESESTIASRLRDAGYATCLAGKWHCSSYFNDPRQPRPDHFGFDHWLASSNNAAPSHRDPTNFVRNGTPVGKMEGFAAQIVVDEAIGFLERGQARTPEQPFFVFIPFHEPHEPVASPEDLVARYRPHARNEDEAQYFANVANVDRAVGRLLQYLQESERLDDTLIFFTSDNGPETLNRYGGAHRSYGRPGPLRGMKLWTTEAGFRVAGILSWPARIKRAAVTDEVVSSLDLMPTLCELAGVGASDDRPLDGTTIVPLLDGAPVPREKPLLWCYYNATNVPRAAMRDGPWKLLARLDSGNLKRLQNVHAENRQRVHAAPLTDFELYRVTDDLAESENLAEIEPEVLARLRAKMESRYRELRADSHVWQIPTGR